MSIAATQPPTLPLQAVESCLPRTNVGGKPQINGCGALVNEVLHDENGAVANAEFGLVDASVAVDHTIETGWFVVQPCQIQVRSAKRRTPESVPTPVV